MPERAVVLANGEIGDAAVITARLRDWRGALVIGADGGSRHAQTLGLRLAVVVGDLDSLDPEQRAGLEKRDVRMEVFPPRKDETDLELALLYAARQNARQIAVLGAAGGRLDMTLANLMLLLHPALAGVHVEVWDGHQTARVIRPPGDAVGGKAGDTLSLIPLGGDAGGVSTRGLEYPLQDEPLLAGPARGASNVLTGPQARVALREGFLLAVHTPGRA